jgi:hypothetical protein
MTARPEAGPWRVGAKLGRTIYYRDECVGMVDVPLVAEQLVAAANAAVASCGVLTAGPVLPPHDRRSALRPHTIKNCWQVWSGGLCIALIDDEMLPEELRGHWRKP